MGIARPRIGDKFGPKKDLGMVSKCGFNNIRQGLNKSSTTRMLAILVASIKFYKFTLAGKKINFLCVRVGSSKNSNPNELI